MLSEIIRTANKKGVTKSKVARITTVLLAIVVIASGVGGEVRYGGICFLGIEQILAVCPMGFLERVLVARDLLSQFWIPVAVSVFSVILLGRVFCAWICPSVIVKRIFTEGRKARLERKLVREENFWVSYSSYGVLAGVLAASFWFRFPIFCFFCPIGLFFGSLYAIGKIFSPDPLSVELALFPVMLGVELYVLKSWCRSFCPIGALLSVFGNLNRLLLPTVPKDKCLNSKGADCNMCEKACPEGIDIDDIRKQYSPSSCTKCLECSDACPLRGIKFPVWAR